KSIVKKETLESNCSTKKIRSHFYKNNSNNSLVDFYENELLSRFYNLDQAFDLDFISSIFSSRFALPLQDAGGGRGGFFLLIQAISSQSLLRSPQI
ncbi:MAG: hypothetical protein ACFBSE_01335, partial [Prochloraceae cyanobacterium]